jgi:hypothetical protein
LFRQGDGVAAVASKPAPNCTCQKIHVAQNRP